MFLLLLIAWSYSLLHFSQSFNFLVLFYWIMRFKLHTMLVKCDLLNDYSEKCLRSFKLNFLETWIYTIFGTLWKTFRDESRSNAPAIHLVDCSVHDLVLPLFITTYFFFFLFCFSLTLSGTLFYFKASASSWILLLCFCLISFHFVSFSAAVREFHLVDIQTHWETF